MWGEYWKGKNNRAGTKMHHLDMSYLYTIQKIEDLTISASFFHPV